MLSSSILLAESSQAEHSRTNSAELPNRTTLEQNAMNKAPRSQTKTETKTARSHKLVVLTWAAEDLRLVGASLGTVP